MFIEAVEHFMPLQVFYVTIQCGYPVAIWAVLHYTSLQTVSGKLSRYCYQCQTYRGIDYNYLQTSHLTLV